MIYHIPLTKAMQGLKLDVDLVNVHAAGGTLMMQEAMKGYACLIKTLN